MPHGYRMMAQSAWVVYIPLYLIGSDLVCDLDGVLLIGMLCACTYGWPST